MRKYFSSYWIRSAFYSFLQRFSLTVFGLVNFIVLIRSLSKEQMGIWALFLTTTTIFETTKSALLKNAHIKFVSGSLDNANKSVIASSSLLINATLSIVFILLIVFFGRWLSDLFHAKDDLSSMLTWFIPGLVCMIFFSHFEAVQQSHFDFKGVFAGHLTRQLSFFIFILVQFFSGKPFSLVHLAIYQSISIFLGTIMIFLFSRKYLLYLFNPTMEWIKKILGYGSFIFGSGLVSSIFSNLDQMMIARFIAPVSVAYYNAATRINGFIDIPTYAAGEILFPKISLASAEEGTGKVRYLYEKMLSILLSFITPAAIFIIIFPKFVITLIAGPQYLAAAPILQLYMVTSLLGPIQNQAANVLNSIGRPGFCFFLNVISLLLKFCVTYLCLLKIGFYGAAIGTVITSVLSTILWYIIMQRQIGLKISNVFAYAVEFYKTIFSNSKKILRGNMREA